MVLMGEDPDAFSCIGKLISMCRVVILPCQEEIMKMFGFQEDLTTYYADRPSRFRNQRMSEHTRFQGWS